MAYKQGTIIKQIGLSPELYELLKNEALIFNMKVPQYIVKLLTDRFENELKEKFRNKKSEVKTNEKEVKIKND